MTTEEAINAHLDEFPGDTLARLALADWLEDEGRGDEAEGQRWLAASGLIAEKCPSENEPETGWCWWYESTQDGDPAQLPNVIVERMPNGRWLYPTRTDAEAVVIGHARAAGMLNPEGVPS